ncbi:aspartyl protease family protein [Sphingomicrobium lutaoense]|uniref:Putative aspartyl protease n=1 Tax=Sphingomicrobium lutaoense TaxID=515949 RepID=A0A839Z4D6_9SPHN|nr:aspartyl protease family protein [Sphingomicrobium lutaoense]MBB3764713.1 putative aspartyl protease [Sphingomicrobium lutaoense]
MMRRIVTSAKLLLAATGALTLTATAAAQEEQERPSKPRPAPDDPDERLLPLPPAEFDNELAIGGEDVEAKKIETRLSVEVEINGTGPYQFIVDSGADTSAVGFRIANDLNLPLSTPATMVTINSRDIVDRVHVASLGLGPTTTENLVLPVLRESDMGGEGMIGIDALASKRLLMDFDDKVIKVEDARRKIRSEPGEIVITARRQRGQLILTEVDASGVKLDAIIDTGSQISIGNSALRREFTRRQTATIEKTEIIGVTGQTADIDIAILKELELGPITLRNVPVAFADVQPLAAFGLADEPALLLGTDILEKFRSISLDFKSRKVRFRLRRCHTQRVVLGPAARLSSRIKANDHAACR